MAQYIDKDVLVADINKRISCNKKRKEWENIPEKRHQLIIEGQLLGELKHFLDTLEVKEVNLDNHTIMEEIRKCGCNPSEFDVARHFFELGLKHRKSEHGTRR